MSWVIRASGTVAEVVSQLKKSGPDSPVSAVELPEFLVAQTEMIEWTRAIEERRVAELARLSGERTTLASRIAQASKALAQAIDVLGREGEKKSSKNLSTLQDAVNARRDELSALERERADVTARHQIAEVPARVTVVATGDPQGYSTQVSRA